MGKIIRNFAILLTAIIILVFPVLNAQDITGNWYGVSKTVDSLHVNLYIFKNHDSLKATWYVPDQGKFVNQIDKITFEKDTLFFSNAEYDVTYKGCIKQDYSIIYGDWIQWGNKCRLDFGRKKLMRIIPVDQNSLSVMPAEVKTVKAGTPQKTHYTGIKVIEAGSPKVIEIDTSELKVLTPGKNTISNPIVYKFPEHIIKGEYTEQFHYLEAPVIIKAKQSEPIAAQPMRMKDAACLNIQYLDMEQGLLDPDIRCILEDSKGNIWFGSTLSGVCRYDGKSLTYYTTKEGLPNNGVKAIIEDRNGYIWIGTDFGICKYDGKAFTQYTGQIFKGIRTLLESENGSIWFGSEFNGASEIKGDFLTPYTENEGLINNSVWAIIEDRAGNIWFGTDGGVCKFDGLSFTHFIKSDGSLSNKVMSITEDKYGYLWIGSDWGVSRYDGKSFQQFTVDEGISFNYTTAIKEDNNGYLWFGTGGGLNIYDGKSFTNYTIQEGLSNNNLFSITEDKSMNIWLTTCGSGIMKLQRNSFTYFKQFEDIGKNRISSIIEDQSGNIWFGVIGTGLVKYNGESFMLMTQNEGLNNTAVRSMLEDKNGNIWTDNFNWGLQKYDGNSIRQYNFKEVQDFAHTECIYEDIKGDIWLGTWGKGIIKFHEESFTFFSGIDMYQSTGFITSILQDNNENIWYGSDPWGLFKYDGKCITQYNINEGLSDMWVSSLFEDKTGNLWIGTIEGGVNKFNDESFTCFTEKEGLSNNSVSSIIGDNKGNIWIGTKKGLSLLSPRGDGNYSITSFDTDNGLKDLNFNENSVCLDSRNRLWWGTGNIITMLDLNTFQINTKPPVIQLNSIDLNQKHIDFGALLPGIEKAELNPSDTSARMKMRGLIFSDVAPFYNYPIDLKLPHYLNHVTFDFSAIDWSAPQSIRYQYMLEGMDKKWSPLSMENKADYRNIPSGKYTFKVKAISIANIWSETFEYPFTVRAPWWFRWWAYLFYVIVLILLARYYIRYIVSRERIKAEVQIKQVEVEKMQELDQMKSRFFANISHEFRTPLTLLMGPINDLQKKRDRLKENDRKLLAVMKRNAERLQQLINQLMDLSKLETGNLKLEVREGDMTWFIRTIVLSFLSLAESKRINYEYDLQDAPAPCFYDEDKVEKITTNLISNALKFTPEEGSVMVTLLYTGGKDAASGQYAEIRVKDTGPGIPDNEKEKIFDRFYQVSSSDTRAQEGSGIGLALTKELVELYRGEIHVKSEPGKGSIFAVMLPVSREHFREGEIVAVKEKPAEVEFIDDHGILVQEAAEPKDIGIGKDKDRPVILIVEDNTDLRKYISGNLLRDYQILEAENGREGLNIAIESIPDLVISDLMMPEMDGVEMCDRLKKDTRTNHIPLVMLTAKADRDSKLESLETGADDYIIKPFDAEELRVRVKNLIEQRKKLREHYRKEFLADPAGHEIPLPEDEFLFRVMDCLKKHLAESEFRVEHLGKELGFSRSQLYRKILALTDHTPAEYIRNIRLKMAARMFLEGHKNVTRVLYTVGFNAPSYFTQSFRELYGLNPSDYIKQKT